MSRRSMAQQIAERREEEQRKVEEEEARRAREDEPEPDAPHRVRAFAGSGPPCRVCHAPVRAGNASGVHHSCRSRKTGDGKGPDTIGGIERSIPKMKPGRIPRAEQLTPEAVLAKMLGPFLRKAAKMEEEADALETRISIYHRRASALRDAASKLRKLAEPKEDAPA